MNEPRSDSAPDRGSAICMFEWADTLFDADEFIHLCKWPTGHDEAEHRCLCGATRRDEPE